MRLLRSVLCLLLLSTWEGAAAPKEPPTPPAPPMAQAQNLSIFRGRSVEISLRAAGRTPGQMRFLIRTKPKAGRLGELRVTGPRTATVTYTHSDGEAGVDQFTFAVQASDSPVSAPGQITITISEEPPALSVVHTLDFGTILVGETREEEITIRNAGGGLLVGKMSVPPPWNILGSPAYRLGRHEEARIRIQFAPGEQREFSGKLVFTHDVRSVVELSGGAISPLEIQPFRELEIMSSQRGGAVRSGTLVVRNRTDRERSVSLAFPSELTGPTELTIPAQTEQKAVLQTVPEFIGSMEGKVDIESEGFKRSLVLKVFAQPPVLKVEPREGLDFGEIEARRRYRGVLRVKNDGGSPARLRAILPSEVLLIPDPRMVIVEPGETRLFQVSFECAFEGAYRAEILIEAEGAKGVSTGVSAKVASPAAAVWPEKVSTAQRAPIVEEPPVPEVIGQGEVNNNIPPIREVLILKATNRRFELGWKKPSPEAAGYLIEQRMIEPANEGPPNIYWRPLSKIRYLHRDDLEVARIENLAPGQTWFMRVVSLDAFGRRSDPSPTFKIASTPVRRSNLGWWILALAAGAGLWWYFSRREPEPEPVKPVIQKRPIAKPARK